MCGITGVWNFNNRCIDDSEFVNFTNSLSHRGPDNMGFYKHCDGKLALGHRRLSIIDLHSSANQPLKNNIFPYVISYNGELYNYLSIKRDLEKLGYSFKTNSDTEVVLLAFIEWGKECLNKFNGMWAFAIWNEKSEELFLSRDRFGIKPLFYSFKENKFFLFASETIAFKNYSPFKRSICNSNLLRSISKPNELEGFGYTIFEDIFQILPGHYLELNTRTKKIKQIKWWDSLKKNLNIPDNYKEQVSHFRELFEDSCLMRLRSDVKIGTALSGGVDSSSVYCMINHLNNVGKISNDLISNNSWKNAFVATFPGTYQDEKVYAEKVIEYTKGDVNYLEPDFNEISDKVVNSTRLFDSITGTPITIVSSIYSEMKRLNIKVSLDGHGVDELMYGYQSNVQEVYFDSLLQNDDEYSKDILETFSNMFLTKDYLSKKKSLKIRGEHIVAFENKINQEFFIKKIAKKFYHFFDKKYSLPEIVLNDLFGSYKAKSLRHLSNSPHDFSNMSIADKGLAISFHLSDMPYNLRDFDRASMQESVEIRMPFLDWRIVKYLYSLPLKSKIGNGYTKKILRDSMLGLMPEEIRLRKLKIGLSAPLDVWLMKGLKSLVIDELNSKSFLDSSYWDGKRISHYYNEKYKVNNFSKLDFQILWNILNAHLIVNNN